MTSPEFSYPAPGEIIRRLEIERKGFAKYLPQDIKLQLQTAPFVIIDQGYLKDGTRLRREILQDGREIYTETNKSDGVDREGLAKWETERVITKGEFDDRWNSAQENGITRRIRKRRYFLDDGLEINVFEESVNGKSLEGRIIVEKEFSLRGSLHETLLEAKSSFFPKWVLETNLASSKKIANGQIPKRWRRVIPKGETIKRIV